MANLEINTIECGLILAGLILIQNNKDFIKLTESLTGFGLEDLESLIKNVEDFTNEMIVRDYQKVALNGK